MTIRNAVGMLKRPSRAAGFTLIEILLVIVIILLLAGALVVFVLPQQESAGEDTTKLMLSQVANALGHLPAQHRTIRPKTKAGWTPCSRNRPSKTSGSVKSGPARYVKPGTTLEDPWPTNSSMSRWTSRRSPATRQQAQSAYKLYSVGPDGQPDTEDDIKYMTETDTGERVAPPPAGTHRTLTMATMTGRRSSEGRSGVHPCRAAPDDVLVLLLLGAVVFSFSTLQRGAELDEGARNWRACCDSPGRTRPTPDARSN